MFRKCKKCNKKFKIYPSTIKFNRGKFCSNKCRYQYGFSEDHKRKIGIANSIALKGIKRSKEFCIKASKRWMKEKNPRWNNGIIKDKRGYVHISKSKHPFCDKRGYVCEHRLVMEKHLGRYLKPIERVHHINSILSDNRIENLLLFKNDSKHKQYHYPKGTKFGINK